MEKDVNHLWDKRGTKKEILVETQAFQSSSWSDALPWDLPILWQATHN